ncbi:MAG: 3-phosphoshikimate 1-carboxyvinyltransferase [Candidatus Portiera sp.]|nr:3-phosphoshikimate 1-carboxyvinyltransferase [Portiera sp.]
MGLMGGSLALAIKKHKLAKEIIAYDSSSNAIDYAVKKSMVQRGETDLSLLQNEGTKENDLIIIAVPLSATESIIQQLNPSIKGMVTEIGSAKNHLYKICKAHCRHNNLQSNFIPCHPLAGVENNGIANAHEDLYNDKKCLITPFETSSPEKVLQLAEFWQAIKSVIFYMDVNQHDKVFSHTSHLPHLLAYTLIGSLASDKNLAGFMNYSGGGLRDFCRIASSDEKMWSDIFTTNKDQLIKSISRFQNFLGEARHALQSDDKEGLFNSLCKSRKAKQLLEDSHGGNRDDEIDYIVSPCTKINGEIRVDSDKSISHRSIIIGSLATGSTQINNFLGAEDTINTLNILKILGAQITHSDDYSSIKIKGDGLDGLQQPRNFLNCGNSGTAARLLCGALSAQKFSSQLYGDSSLSSRPMGRIIDPLTQMGANIYASNNNNIPLLIMGNRKLSAITYKMPVASAQIKSAILLAGLYAPGQTIIQGGAGSRDHTERMLKNFGYKVSSNKNGDVSINGKQTLHASHINIPADISSAAFFMVAASITPGSDIVLKDVGINPSRTGIIEILKLMGGKIELINQRQYGNEQTADIQVCHSKLKAIDIGHDLVTIAIDEMPVVMIAAAYAEGTTKISGAAELRVKETDRIAAMVDGLTQLKINAKSTEDGAIIEGGSVQGGTVDSYEDHRIAMSFAVAACGAKQDIHITSCANIATSFPNFAKCASTVGFNIQLKEANSSATIL